MEQHPYSVLSVIDVKGEIILTPCPGTQNSSVAAAIDTLKEAGVAGLLTLMSTEELKENAVEELPEVCRRRGIVWFHLPVENGQIPDEQFLVAWKSNIAQIKSVLQKGKAVAVHCKGGSGRTGLIAAQLMIACGEDFQDALEKVKTLRPRAITRPQHVEYLTQFDMDCVEH